jgi:hypothetical protein
MLFIKLIKLSSILWLALSYNINAEISVHLAEHHHAHVHDHAHVHLDEAKLQVVKKSEHEHKVVDLESFTSGMRLGDVSGSLAPLQVHQINAPVSFSEQNENYLSLNLAYRPPPDKFRNLPMLN